MGDAKMTAVERVDMVELTADDCNNSTWVVLRVDAIRIAEEHAAAAVAEHQARVAELEAEVERVRARLQAEISECHRFVEKAQHSWLPPYTTCPCPDCTEHRTREVQP